MPLITRFKRGPNKLHRRNKRKDARYNSKYVINMHQLTPSIEYDIISLYKHAIWISVCNIRFNQEKITIRTMRATYRKELSVYLSDINGWFIYFFKAMKWSLSCHAMVNTVSIQRYQQFFTMCIYITLCDMLISNFN